MTTSIPKTSKNKTPTNETKALQPLLLHQAEPKPPSARRNPAMLRFTPYAWAKLLFLRDAGGCEVGGFGICQADDLLLVTDLSIPRQDVSPVSVVFDDGAVADHFDRQIDLGRRPEQVGRLWIHTHPGDSPTPSVTDEDCFARVFGRCDWAVMFILARGGKSFARLRFNVGPSGQIAIPVEVDYSAEFTASAHADWKAEYDQNVRPHHLVGLQGCALGHEFGESFFTSDWLEGLEQMEPAERQAVLADLQGDEPPWTWEDVYE